MQTFLVYCLFVIYIVRPADGWLTETPESAAIITECSQRYYDAVETWRPKLVLVVVFWRHNIYELLTI